MRIRAATSTVITTVPGPRRRGRRPLLIGGVIAAAVMIAAGGFGVGALADASAGAPGGAAAGPKAAAAGPKVDTTGFPRGTTGIFTDTCALAKTAPDDPIMMPGMPGKSMQHNFFGNLGTTASTTAAQLVGGSTTCSTSADASAYWTPVLSQNGTALAPTRTLIYWRAPAATAKQVTTVPAGLTMIAGNEVATTPQGRQIIGWTCAAGRSAGTPQPTTDSPHDCTAGHDLRLVVTFPNCWDGTTLNGKTRTNVVYASTPKSVCPASHPVQIPQAVVHINYPTTSAAGLALSIAPDATGPVTTAHADFMNGWNEPVVTADAAACIATQTRCGPVSGATAVPKGGKALGARLGRMHRAGVRPKKNRG